MLTATTQETPTTPVELLERIVRSARPVSTRTVALERRMRRIAQLLEELTPLERESAEGRRLNAQKGEIASEIMVRRAIAAIRAAGIRGVRQIPLEAMERVIVMPRSRCPVGMNYWPLSLGFHDWTEVPERLRGALVAQSVHARGVVVRWNYAGEELEAEAPLPMIRPQRLRDRHQRAARAASEGAECVATEYLVWPAQWGEVQPVDPLAVLRLQRYPSDEEPSRWLLVGRYGPTSAAEASIVERAGA